MIDELAREVAALGDDVRIREILGEVCRITEMGFAAVAFVSEERWIACQVEDRIEFGLDPGSELEIKKTICDDIRKSGTAIIVDHIGADPAWRTHPVPGLYGFESYASLPLFLGDGRFFGTLCAIDPSPHLLSSHAIVAVLRGFAVEVAAILTEKIGARPFAAGVEPVA